MIIDYKISILKQKNGISHDKLVKQRIQETTYFIGEVRREYNWALPVCIFLGPVWDDFCVFRPANPPRSVPGLVRVNG